MDDIEWTIVNEGQLLDAMVGHKPVGINKHFQMALICEKFGNNVNKDVDPERIWEHLSTMYNLEALDENESIPFPNHERDFKLPDDDFGELMSSKDEYRSNDVTKLLKETPNRNVKDSSKDGNNTKDTKRDSEKVKTTVRNRNSNGSRSKNDETPKTSKRPLRGSLKIDDGSSNGKSSPTPSKRRRII